MPLRVALLVLGVSLGLWARLVAVTSAGISPAARTSWGTIFLLVVGWSVMVAAAVVLPERRRSALLLYTIGVWWFLIELASPSVGFATAFTAGLVLYAAGPALVAHLGLTAPTGRIQRPSHTVIVVVGYAVMLGVIGIGGTIMFDPQSTGCPDCPTNLLLIGSTESLAEPVNLIGVRLDAVWLLIALAAIVWRTITTGPPVRGSTGPIAFAAAIFLGASAAPYLASLSAGVGSGGAAHVVWQLHGVSLLGLALAMCLELWLAHRARRDLTRLVIELPNDSPGGLRAALAKRLDDPSLLIAYPIERGRRYVDVGAHDVDVTPTAERSVTHLVKDGVELAALVHRPGLLKQAQQVDDLAASVQLALESERLTAEDLAQLVEIRSSGVRIVEAGDTERRRIERDLHDGAQQRLVALLLRMRLIRGEVASPGLVGAENELRETIADLRELAHGVYPVLLKDAGLRAAFDGLAETRHLVVTGDADDRYLDVIESTVYLVVARLSNAGPATARIDGDGSRLIVELAVAGRAEPVPDLTDRVHTLGGTLDLAMTEATTRATLTLPIALDRDLGSA